MNTMKQQLEDLKAELTLHKKQIAMTKTDNIGEAGQWKAVLRGKQIFKTTKDIVQALQNGWTMHDINCMRLRSSYVAMPLADMGIEVNYTKRKYKI